MKNKLYPPQRKRKAGAIVIAPPITLVPNGFTFANGIANPNRVTWGDWLMTQSAPVAKPKHKLDYLTSYVWGQSQEYNIVLDLLNRWGYALNIGYNSGYEYNIADAKTANPTTSNGKLLKLAINDPAKYPVALAVNQAWYPDEGLPWEQRVLKEAYLRDAQGNVIGDWSPEATPYAMSISIAYKCEVLYAHVALGINITNIYDGGETGLHAAYDDPQGNFGRDPRVLAAKGNIDWVDYLSLKKGQQCQLLHDGVKAACPNRNTYITYGGSGGNGLLNIPGARNYSFNSPDMMYTSDVPTNVLYYRDFGVPEAGMGNPNIMYSLYKDSLTHYVAGAVETVAKYGLTTSYNWVSAGSLRFSPNALPFYYCPIPAYKGFLKCLYALGQKGAVAGYFTDDILQSDYKYPVYNPVNPPHWLMQEMALGEVHHRFTWFDEFIINGDMVLGVGNDAINGAYPKLELTGNNKVGDFYFSISTIRVFARKLRGQDKWLVVLWSAESGTNTTSAATGVDTLVWVIDIPGVEPLQLNARGQGSIYTVDRTSGVTVVKLEDPAIPNVLDTPSLVSTYINPLATQMVLKLYAIKGINHTLVPPVSAFTVSGATVNSVTLVRYSAAQTYLTLSITNNSLAPNSAVTVAYSGTVLTDYETNILPAFTSSTTLYPSIFQNLSRYIYAGNNVYTSDEADWYTHTMSSTVKALGDCTIEADLVNNVMLALSPEATNVGDYRTWAYACNSGFVYSNSTGNVLVLNGWAGGVPVATGTYAGIYTAFASGDRAQLKRVGGVVTISKKAQGATAFTLCTTYPVNSTAALYLHAAFYGTGSKIANVTTTGFS